MRSRVVGPPPADGRKPEIRRRGGVDGEVTWHHGHVVVLVRLIRGGEHALVGGHVLVVLVGAAVGNLAQVSFGLEPLNRTRELRVALAVGLGRAGHGDGRLGGIDGERASNVDDLVVVRHGFARGVYHSGATRGDAVVASVCPLAGELYARNRISVPQALDRHLVGNLSLVLVDRVPLALRLAVVYAGLRKGRDGEHGLEDRNQAAIAHDLIVVFRIRADDGAVLRPARELIARAGRCCHGGEGPRPDLSLDRAGRVTADRNRTARLRAGRGGKGNREVDHLVIRGSVVPIVTSRHLVAPVASRAGVVDLYQFLAVMER